MSEIRSDQMPITPPDNLRRLPDNGNTSDNDGLQGPFLVIEGGRPPDIFFDNLSVNQFLPTTSVIETTDDARLRTGLRNIAEQIDDADVTNTYLDPAYRARKKLNSNAFFSGKETIDGQKIRRDDLVDLDLAAKQLVARLIVDNDPVAQYINQLIDELREHEAVNIGALNVFVRSLLIVTHWSELRSICKQQIKDKRS
jgi:hypothetical protein